MTANRFDSQMSEVRYQVVSKEEEGQRLDNYLIRLLKGVPKSHIYRIIRAGEVRVNKKRAAVSTRLIDADVVRIPPIRCAQEPAVYVGDKLKSQLLSCILFEDKELIVINKPAGMAVHGGSGLHLGLIEALRKLRTDLTYIELVHRLDKDTSGCLLLAKKRSFLRALQQLFSARDVKKDYWALVNAPWVGDKERLVKAALEKNTLQSGERMVFIKEDGKPSTTVFTLLENYHQCCLVLARPETGRTHQIRVHSAYIHHPIIGDDKYGRGPLPDCLQGKKTRLYLHARAIEFTLNEQFYRFEAPLDKHFLQTLTHLRAESVYPS